MKKLALIYIALIAIACTRHDKAIVRFKINHAQNKFVCFDAIDTSGIHAIDSIKIDGNHYFKQSISLTNPGYYQLRLSADNIITLLLFPGENVEIVADYNRLNESKTIDGLKDTKRVIVLEDSLRKTKKILSKILDHYDSVRTIPGNEIKTDSLWSVYRKTTDNYKKFSLQFILSDLKSLANLEAIYQQYFTNVYVFNSNKDVQFYKLVSDTLNKYYPNVGLVVQLKSDYKLISSNLEKAKMMQLVKRADNHVPDLTLSDKNGRLKSLSSFRGKITLLTFWSINQQESIDNLMELKKVYNHYHTKGFEIYQVSIDKSFSDWKSKLEKYGIAWISVCDTAFPNSKTRNLFNVNTLPMNYLINKDQTDILAKNIEPDKLDNKLKEIMK